MSDFKNLFLRVSLGYLLWEMWKKTSLFKKEVEYMANLKDREVTNPSSF